VGRFWLEGRQRKCKVPDKEKPKHEDEEDVEDREDEENEDRERDGFRAHGRPSRIEKRLKALEDRLREFIEDQEDAQEEAREARHKFLVTIGVLVLLRVLGVSTYFVVQDLTTSDEWTGHVRSLLLVPTPDGRGVYPVELKRTILTLELDEGRVDEWEETLRRLEREEQEKRERSEDNEDEGS